MDVIWYHQVWKIQEIDSAIFIAVSAKKINFGTLQKFQKLALFGVGNSTSSDDEDEFSSFSFKVIVRIDTSGSVPFINSAHFFDDSFLVFTFIVTVTIILNFTLKFARFLFFLPNIGFITVKITFTGLLNRFTCLKNEKKTVNHTAFYVTYL